MKVVQHNLLGELLPVTYCQSLSLFGALTEDCILWLLKHGEVQQCDEGEQLFTQGECSSFFYIVLTGELGYYRHNGIERVFLRNYKSGEQLGFSSMIGLHERRGDAVAHQEGYMLKITCDLFHEMHNVYPEQFGVFQINIARELSREVIDLDAQCADLRTKLNRYEN